MSRVQRVVNQLRRVSNQRAKPLGQREILFGETCRIEGYAVSRAAHGVLLGYHAFQFLAKSRGIEQVADADSVTRHFVFIGGANSARRCTDFPGAARRLGRLLHLTVIGKDQVGAVGKMQTSGDVDPGFGQRVEFSNQGRRVHDHSRSDYRVLARAQDSAGDQLQDKSVSVEDDGVAGVVASRASRDVIE